MEMQWGGSDYNFFIICSCLPRRVNKPITNCTAILGLKLLWMVNYQVFSEKRYKESREDLLRVN